MTVIPPIAARNIGAANGGGFMDSITGAAGAGAAPAAKDDGSVGLFDKLFSKVAVGAAAGAGLGMILPFGGPLIGGVVGALGGAAIGVFSNWKKMDAIRKENDATLAALGVQTDDPQVQQILQSGNVEQLIPMMQQQGGMLETPVQQTSMNQLPPQQLPMQQAPIQQAPQTVGAGAFNPAGDVNPGVAPMLPGGGGAAGDAGRPDAPVGVEGSDASAIAPRQAEFADSAAEVAAPTDVAQMTDAQLTQMIMDLQRQIDELRAYLDTQRDAANVATAAR